MAQRTIGKYRILSELGRGRYGRVYKAQHFFFTNRIVAIKLMQDTEFASAQEKELFFQEARFLEQLKHPYILPVIDIDIHEDSPFLVTEYAPNGSLTDRLKKQASAPLSEAEILAILSQIGQALQYAHQQTPAIVHRDIKPDNILFNAKGEAVLADFGIATVLASSGTQVVGGGGTPYYMAPEQFEGVISTKSDQYALGCIAYELFTGQKPFDAPYPSMEIMWYQHAKVEPTSPTQLNTRLAKNKEQSILKAMAKSRANRYADVAAFIAALATPATPILRNRPLRLDVAQLTDVGRTKPHNEDNMAYVIPSEATVLARNGAMFIACDGLEAYPAGEVASELAVDNVTRLYYRSTSEDSIGDLIQAVKQANTIIYQRAAERAEQRGMGSSSVVAVAKNNTLYVTNIGNCRAYIIRDKQVAQTSRDQQASWLGAYPDIQVHISTYTIQPNDYIVLCTPGLWRLVSQDEMQTIVSSHTPQESVYHLVERANANGGIDNITVIVVRIVDC